MKNEAITLPKQDTTILFVTNKPEQKELFSNLIKGKDYNVLWEENSFKAIQCLKSDDANLITIMVLDKDVKPLGSFQTYDFMKSELNLNIPVFIAQEEDDQHEYKEYDDLEVLNLELSEKSLTKIETFIERKQDFNGYNPISYSLNYLKELSENNEEFINDSLQLFLNSVSERMIEMKVELSKNKFKKVYKIAHNIKPSFGIIENEAGHHLCDYLAHHATDEELPEMVNKLDRLFVKLKGQLLIDYPKYAVL